MSQPILIVEDEFFIAFEMQSVLEKHGYKVVGIAADLEGALAKAQKGAALALVDLHLRDGLTGPDIGARLAQEFGVTVLFVTANPHLLGDGVAGTIGAISKPTDHESLLSAVNFAMERHHGHSLDAPQGVHCFH